MKRIGISLIFICLAALSAQAEDLLLIGGYCIKDAQILANDKGDIVFETNQQHYRLHNKYFIRVLDHAADHIKRLSPERIEDYKKAADRYLEKKAAAKKAADSVLHPLACKIGPGFGRDFGGTGMNLEILLSDASSLAFGLGTVQVLYPQLNQAPLKGCLTFRSYLGGPIDQIRGNLAISFSNGVLAESNAYYYSTSYTYYAYPDFSLTFGVQIRPSNVLSIDMSGGLAVGFLSRSKGDGVLVTPAVNIGLMFGVF